MDVYWGNMIQNMQKFLYDLNSNPKIFDKGVYDCGLKSLNCRKIGRDMEKWSCRGDGWIPGG